MNTAPRSCLHYLLEKHPVLLADGATGTNLFKMGLEAGEAPEMWLVEQPDKIRALHQSFVDAGADIILTNTFGANRRRLMLHKAEHRVHELSRIAAELARAVADASGRMIAVAGSVGPTGDLFEPLGPMTEVEAIEVFAEQIAGMKEGGIDVVWIETMSAPEEMRAAALAAQQCGMPYALTGSFDTAGRTMMGLTPEAFARFMATLGEPPVAFGANCGVGASDLLVSVGTMTAENPEAIVIAKGNCGVPQFVGEVIHYSGTPEVMSNYACLAIDSGVRIIGGCCGTAPEHLAAMRLALNTHRRGERPTLERIVAEVGGLMAPPPSEEAMGRDRRAGRRRG